MRKFDNKEIAKWIKESVKELIVSQQGCGTLKLDDHLAICTGWSAGYGEEKRDDVIQGKDEPDYAICVGLKVWTSDDLRTDFDYINCPYYEDGECADFSVSISPNEDYEKLAKWLLDCYGNLEACVIRDDGLIEENPDLEYEIEDRIGTWYEIDDMKVGDDCYKLFESCVFGEDADHVLVKLPKEKFKIKERITRFTSEKVYFIPKECEVSTTMDDIETALEDEGIL